MSADYVAALDVRIGDRVRWCGRWGEVVEISPTYKQRKGRWLTVALDGTPRRLHYFNVEILEAMRQFDGGGAGSQDPSDEAQQRPLRGSMPSPATDHSDGDVRER